MTCLSAFTHYSSTISIEWACLGLGIKYSCDRCRIWRIYCWNWEMNIDIAFSVDTRWVYFPNLQRQFFKIEAFHVSWHHSAADASTTQWSPSNLTALESVKMITKLYFGRDGFWTWLAWLSKSLKSVFKCFSVLRKSIQTGLFGVVVSPFISRAASCALPCLLCQCS